MKVRLVAALSAALALGSGAAWADTVSNESLLGDFSNDGLTPTMLVFNAGANTVIGQTGNSGSGVDRDYFFFTVPVGLQLSGLRILNTTSISGSSSFLALQAGPQITSTPTGEGSEALLGFAHYTPDMIGADILPFLIFDFSGALPAGTYSAWVQETGGLVDYALAFDVTGATEVPLPATLPLLLGGLATLFARTRGRKVAATAA